MLRPRIPAALLTALIFALAVGCGSDNSTANDADQADTSAMASADDSPAPESTMKQQPITKALVSSLLQRGDQLYSDANDTLDDIPQTQMQAAELVRGSEGPIGSWYARDRQYQSDIPKMDLSANGNGDLNLAIGNLAEFETFANSAVVAVATCNGEDARRDIKVAKAYLDEAHKDFHGEGNPNWEPPSDALNDTEHVECQE